MMSTTLHADQERLDRNKRAPTGADTCHVLVVGQTPPPYHGQAIMVDRLVQSRRSDLRVSHVRMAFSKSMDEVGRPGLRKVWHLVHVVMQIIGFRLRQRFDVLYYPPAGPSRVPVWRDLVILNLTRWLFPRTVFHMQANGISEMYPRMGGLGRWLFRRAYFGADAVVRLSPYTTDDARGLCARREAMIPNCADDEWERFGEQARRRHARPQNDVTLLYLGTVCRTKGILVLLDACRRLRDAQVGFHLRVVGSFQPETFRTEVEHRIAELELSEHVQLLGQKTGDEKLIELAAADIFVFPTFFGCRRSDVVRAARGRHPLAGHPVDGR